MSGGELLALEDRAAHAAVQYRPSRAREIVAEAYELGRKDAGLALAAALRRLVDDGTLTSPAVLAALGPLIPAPAPEAGLRELAETDHDAFMAELDQRVAAWLARISSGTAEGDAELAEFIRRALADPEVMPAPDGWMLLCPSCFRAGGTHRDGCDGIAVPRRVGGGTGTCPDGGACHHGCTAGCFRVAAAGPLAASGWETWPDGVRERYGTTDGVM